MSRDPIGEKGGKNLTAFSKNKGPNGIDPHGLEPRTCDELYERILSKFDVHLDAPPCASSAELVTPDLVAILDHDNSPPPGREKGVLILKMTVQCTPKSGGAGFTHTFYGRTPLIVGAQSSLDPSAFIYLQGGLRRKLYMAGFNNRTEEEALNQGCENCVCKFWGERSAIVHGHSACSAPSVLPPPLPGDPSTGDNNFPTAERSWVLYECPKGSGKWYRHGWQGDELSPRELLQ